VVVIAQHLVPGYPPVEPGGLEGTHEIGDCRGLRIGIRVDDHTVENIDEPSQFIMLRVVDSIAQKNSEVNSLLPVQRVNRLYGGVQHLGSVRDYRRIGRVSSRLSLYLPQPEKQRLSRGLDIGQMDVSHGKKP